MPSPHSHRTPRPTLTAGQDMPVEPTPLALLPLEHVDIVVTDDCDGYGFYVASPCDAIRSTGAAWVFSIDGDTDTLTHADLDALRDAALQGFRDDADVVTLGSPFCSLHAELIRGDAPAPWVAPATATASAA